MLNFNLFMLMNLSLFSVYKLITKHFSYRQKLSSLYNITISVLVTYFFQITDFHCIQHGIRDRDEPILLFPHLYFFLAVIYSNLRIMLNILLKVSTFCSKFSCITNYLKVASYICIPQLCIHIMDSYSYTDHKLVI